jgi:hypothetical protein
LYKVFTTKPGTVSIWKMLATAISIKLLNPLIKFLDVPDYFLKMEPHEHILGLYLVPEKQILKRESSTPPTVLQSRYTNQILVSHCQVENRVGRVTRVFCREFLIHT